MIHVESETGKTSANGKSSTLAIAQQYVAQGLSVIPIRPDGSKAPAVREWETYQKRLPTDAELVRWFSDGRNGLAILGGKVSGNLVILDFETVPAFNEWASQVTEENVNALDNVPIVKSPGEPGRHVYCLVGFAPDGNDVFASSPTPVKQKDVLIEAAKREAGKKPRASFPIIETRGEGGYVVAPGSPRECHESGLYEWIVRGWVAGRRECLADEVYRLFERKARLQNRVFEEAEQEVGKRTKAATKAAATGNWFTDTIDHYNRTASWKTLLEPAGWQEDHSKGEETRWRRPDKDRGHSGVTNHGGRDLFVCFTSSASPFQQYVKGTKQGVYNKFQAYTLLNHGGDYLAAAKALAGERTSTPTNPAGDPPPAGAGAADHVGDAGGHPKDIRQIHLTDTGNAYRFARMHRGEALHCAPWKKWLEWDGTRWRKDDNFTADRFAKAVAHELFHSANCLLGNLPALQLDFLRSETKKKVKTQLNDAQNQIKKQMDVAQAMMNWAIASESAKHITAMLRLAQSELPITPDQLDRDPMLLNCPNGTIDLRTGTLRAHRREDHITKLCPTLYDPAATCPQLERFLAAVLSPAVAAYMRRFIGYCLTGDVREQILTFFYGDGSNGKGVLTEIILHVLGLDYAGPAPEGLLMARKGEQHPTELADLFGKRLVVAAETREGGRLDEPRVKRLTGGDKIKARGVYQDFFEFDPTHKLVIMSNYRPKIIGTDHGIWRRVLLIPFLTKFWDPDKPAQPGEERDPRFRADKLLCEKLKSESAGILAWAVRGCLEWQQGGLQPPAEVIAATEEYRAEQDLVGEFLAERCILTGNKSDRMRSGELFATFQKWGEAAGERTLPGRKTFPQRVEKMTGFNIVRNNGSWFCGITYNQTNESGFQEE